MAVTKCYGMGLVEPIYKGYENQIQHAKRVSYDQVLITFPRSTHSPTAPDSEGSFFRPQVSSQQVSPLPPPMSPILA